MVSARALFMLVVSVTIAACSGPFVLLPGGALEGEAVPSPDDWSFTEAVNTVQFETDPTAPYSVNIWVVAIGEHLYVHAGTKRAAWVENIEASPEVRLAVNGSIYELLAARVEGQPEFDRFSDAYERKYGRRPGNERASEAYLFRLAARPPRG